jgi:RND superfamily putative drug exporter
VTYLVLVLFFHSLILPLKAILLNVIAILASYGVLVLVFQHGVGSDLLAFESDGRLSMFSPVILFSILFGLSTDYEVFLLSRVKEIYAHTHDNDHSVAMGLERTAGIITAAGLIMICVFGSFALGSTLVIKELGIGLAVAVLLDSTIIRIILVPASMKLMGDANWWMPKAAMSAAYQLC